MSGMCLWGSSCAGDVACVCVSSRVREYSPANARKIGESRCRMPDVSDDFWCTIYETKGLSSLFPMIGRLVLSLLDSMKTPNALWCSVSWLFLSLLKLELETRTCLNWKGHSGRRELSIAVLWVTCIYRTESETKKTKTTRVKWSDNIWEYGDACKSGTYHSI